MWPRHLLLSLAITGSACGDDGRSPNDGSVPDGAPDPHMLVATIHATPNRNVDLLFVIDDSSSMADKQANLTNNFPNFINVLNTLEGGFPDIHIGVVSTDMGTKGSADAAPGAAIGQIGNGGCAGTGKAGNLQTSGATVTGAFISDLKLTDGTRLKNYTGNLADVFAQMARVGSGGCGFEQPLAAMKAALNNNAANAGFLRPDALLGVVFVTDEDDCSMTHSTLLGPESAALGPLLSFRCTRFGVTCSGGGATSDEMNQVGPKTGCTGSTGSAFLSDVAPFHDFLTQLKGDARKVVVASIMGTPMPVAVELRTPPGGGTQVTALVHSCTYQGAQGIEVADPAVRIKQFLDLFPGANSSSTICQQDQSDALVLISQTLKLAIGSPCIDVALVDADPATAGPQFECIVEDQVGTMATPIPACGPTPAPPCWRFTTDVMNCPVADHLKLVIERAQTPDPATVTRARCLVAP